MSEPCSRCGERERGPSHRWCRECQADARKASRATRTLERRTLRPPLAHNHTVCHRELVALMREVERLKAELAAVRADPRTVPQDLGVAPHGVYCLCFACRRARMRAALEGRGRELNPVGSGGMR